VLSFPGLSGLEDIYVLVYRAILMGGDRCRILRL
jgi:hypothetical protein